MAEEVRVIRAKSSPMPLIVAVILFVVSFFACVYTVTLLSGKDGQIKKAEDSLVKAKKAREEALVEQQQWAEMVTGSIDTSLEAVVQKIELLRGSIRKDFSEILPSEPPSDLNSLDAVTDAQTRLIHALKEVNDRATAEISRLETDNAGFEGQIDEIRAQFDEEVEEARAAAEAAERRSDRARKTYDEQIASLTAQFDEGRERTEKQIRQLANERDKYREELAMLKEEADKARTVQVVESSTEDTYDGKLLVVDDQNGFVVINRGRKEHILRDLVFSVRSPDGVEKGKIEVRKIHEEVSFCAIVGETPLPMTRGDLIYSAAYAPDKELVFVLLPPFSSRHASTGSLAAELERYGNKVVDTVTLSTSFLVVGGGVTQTQLEAEENVARAKQFGVPLLREELLTDYVGLE